jgi:hypothetical protein
VTSLKQFGEIQKALEIELSRADIETLDAAGA